MTGISRTPPPLPSPAKRVEDARKRANAGGGKDEGADADGCRVSERLTTTLLLPTLDEIEAVRVIVPQLRKEWVDEIIVIDGGSTDGTVEYLRAAGLQVHPQTIRGYGEGLLEAIRLAKGDIIIEFNP